MSSTEVILLIILILILLIFIPIGVRADTPEGVGGKVDVVVHIEQFPSLDETDTSPIIPPEVRWENPCVSHNAFDTEAANVNALVGTSLTEWGAGSSVRDCGAGSDITIRWVPTLGSNVLAQAITAWFGGTDYRIAWCQIEMSTAALGSSPQNTVYLVVAHEVGHCLGLNHTTDPGGLMYPFCCNSWAASDRAYIALKYPSILPIPTATLPLPTITPTVVVIPDPPFTPTAMPTAVPTGTPDDGPPDDFPDDWGEPIFREWIYPSARIPADFGWGTIYEFRDGEWYRWVSGAPLFVNSLFVLEKGTSYWFVPQTQRDRWFE